MPHFSFALEGSINTGKTCLMDNLRTNSQSSLIGRVSRTPTAVKSAISEEIAIDSKTYQFSIYDTPGYGSQNRFSEVTPIYLSPTKKIDAILLFCDSTNPASLAALRDNFIKENVKKINPNIKIILVANTRGLSEHSINPAELDAYKNEQTLDSVYSVNVSVRNEANALMHKLISLCNETPSPTQKLLCELYTYLRTREAEHEYAGLTRRLFSRGLAVNSPYSKIAKIAAARRLIALLEKRTVPDSKVSEEILNRAEAEGRLGALCRRAKALTQTSDRRAIPTKAR